MALGSFRGGANSSFGPAHATPPPYLINAWLYVTAPLTQWSVHKQDRTIGKLASQAQIGVWVQTPGVLLRESEEKKL